jgi:tripartite-type tricarboxylate transporter receptor subunit TctC
MTLKTAAGKCLVALGVVITSLATAQPYPARPIKFVVGSAAGSTPDVVGRLLGQRMAEAGGINVVVDNKPGGSGTIAFDAVAKSPADGYTLLLSDTSAWAISPHLLSKLPYDPVNDLIPVAEIGVLPLFLVVDAALPVADLRQLMAYIRQNPNKLSYGSAGNGSIHHIGGELFKSMGGLAVVHVPYRGAPQVATALLSGEIAMAFMSYTAAAQGVSAGKLKILAIGTGKRLAAFPTVPTLNESGMPGYEVYATLGFLAPAKTPADVIQKIHNAINQAAATPELTARFSALGVGLHTGSSAEFGTLVRSEYDRFSRLVKLSGAKVD